MASNVIKATLLADAQKYKAGLADADQATAKTENKMSTFAKVAVAALAVKALAAVKQFVGDSLTAFSDLNESLNAVEVSYGDNAEGIKKLGEEAAAGLGLSNAQFNSFAVSSAAFAKQIAGDTGDVTRVVDSLSTRVSDFASVMNLDVPLAAEKFRAGLAGEAEGLRAFGIDVSDAKVKAFALAEGIWDGVGAMTESEKVQARYGTIMEQTANVQGDFARTAGDAANKQRILDAELENQKALLGGAILPLQQQWQEIQAAAIPIIGDLAKEVGKLTGAISEGQAAMQNWNPELDTAGDLIKRITTETAGHAVAQWLGEVFDLAKADRWVDGMKDAIETGQLTRDQLVNLGHQLETLASQGKLTEEQVDLLTAAIEKQKNIIEQTERPISDNERALYGMAEGQEAVAGETEEATSALQRFEDEVRSQIDPAFALIRSLQDQKAAIQNVIDVEAEFGLESPEYVDALLGQAEAGMDVTAAVLAVAGQVRMTRDQWDTQLIAMGVTTAAQRAVIMAELERINAFDIADKDFAITAKGGAGYGGGKNVFHEGGVVGGPIGSDQVILAKGGETILPTHKGGATRTPVAAAGAEGTVININITAGMGADPNAISKAVVEAIQRYKRNNGGLPF